MSLRFRRSIKLLPGIRLNVSKSGLGISAGVRGAHVGIDAKGHKYSNVGIPGTGLYTRQDHGKVEAPETSSVATVVLLVVIAIVLMTIFALSRN